MSKGFLMVRVAAVALIAIAASAVPMGEAAQANEFINKLDKGLSGMGKTRSLNGKTRSIAVEEKVEEVAKKVDEGKEVTKEDRQEIIKRVETPQFTKIDIAVFFAYNSDQILPEAFPTLIKLGQALNDEKLAGQTFMINGHTDGRGGPEYNLHLSQRRAASVKHFLISNFKVDPKRLVALGFGYEHLKNKAHPGADENRRVEIINVSK